MSETYSAGTLADTVNRWCDQHRVSPASGQAGELMTERNIRYYRTLGLVDAPASGGQGFGRKHRLQLVGIRLLQAQGLPLHRIRDLLYGRGLEELEEIASRCLAEPAETVDSPWRAVRQECWSVTALDEDFLLVSRRGRRISAGLRRRVLAALENNSPTTAAQRQNRKE